MDILVLIDWQICVIEYRTLLIWLEVRGLHKHMQMELGSKKAAILTLAWWLLQLLSGSSGKSRYWFQEVVIKLFYHFVVPLELSTSWDFYFWLLVFCIIICSVGKRSGHIPYRDSKLTRILQHSLGGNARTAIICTLSPALSHVEQSRNTLYFATRAKEVTNNAQVNMVTTSSK
jgi:hypothetical protein